MRPAARIDHFVREDDNMFTAMNGHKLARNFMGYTTDRAETLLGLGVSAISRYPQGYLQNAADMTTYKKMLTEGKLPSLRGRTLSDDDRLRADIISTLMCYFDCDIAAILARHKLAPDHFDDILSGLDDLVSDQVAEINDRRLTIHPKARQLARVVAARFDTYFTQSAQRHVQAA